MNIISTTNISREGNDCYIERTISLVEFCGLYAVIECTSISGFFESKDILIVLKSENYEEVAAFYTRNGGVLNKT